MSDEPKALQARAKTLNDVLVARKSQIAEIVPRYLSTERLIRTVWAEIRKTPALLECTPASMVTAILQAAQAGLEIGGLLGHGYLVPFWNAKQQCREVTFMPGYKGLLFLARASGSIRMARAGVVMKGDDFIYEDGADMILRHVPKSAPDGSNFGEDIVRVWAVIALEGDAREGVALWRDEVEAIRARSKSANSQAWALDWPEMAKKTALRRVLKYAPLSVALARVVSNDERVDAGLDADVDADVGDLGASMAEDLARTQAAAAASAPKGAPPPASDVAAQAARVAGLAAAPSPTPTPAAPSVEPPAATPVTAPDPIEEKAAAWADERARLFDLPRDELAEIAKARGVEKITKLGKAELVEAILAKGPTVTVAPLEPVPGEGQPGLFDDGKGRP